MKVVNKCDGILPSLTHESGRVGLVGPNLPVNLDEALVDNLYHLGVSEGILQSVPEENQQWQALSQLVGPRARSGGLLC